MNLLTNFIYTLTNKVSFPGLGIGDIEIDSVAVTFEKIKINGEPLTIAWYGIIITVAILLACAYIYWMAKKSYLVFDDIIDLAFCAVIPGIIGARTYYVFFDYFKNPQNYTELFDFINIRGGGLAIYGGIIFGAIGILIGLRAKKIRIAAFFDCLAPGVMIAQSLGRWGNFFNCEAYGGPTTLPWRMKITYPTGAFIEVHPTFLYESLWNLLGFILINVFRKKKKFDGQLTLEYLAWYGLGRMFVESLRSDSLYIGSIKVSALVATLCFVICTALFIYFMFIKKRRVVAGCIYTEKSKYYAKYLELTSSDTDDELIGLDNLDEDRGDIEELGKIDGADNTDIEIKTEENENGKNN